MNSIFFNETYFLTREIKIPGIGDVLISTDDLNSLLMSKTGGFTSEEAEAIDEEIFYYVSKEEINLNTMS